jgi:hypothetical protein
MGWNGNKERPAKSSRAMFAFYSPRPPLGRLTKEMGLLMPEDLASGIDREE